MMQKIFERVAASLVAAKTESAFWDALRTATAEIEAWPHGWVMLGTPSMPFACLRQVGLADRMSLVESREFGGTPSIHPLGVTAVGNVRRDVRRGQWVVSAMDTRRQWRVIHDARDTGIEFLDPMVSWGELGFAQETGHARAVA
jgi:hypothetical protein